MIYLEIVFVTPETCEYEVEIIKVLWLTKIYTNIGTLVKMVTFSEQIITP